ncbi:MAG TPA: mechanosensitive ion channel family protein [Planctomycetota bacterium]|nr:mechanosensitive ion channel family protein [Planctomycetota bacterium]
MRRRALLKILFLCLLPSAGLLAVAYVPGLRERVGLGGVSEEFLRGIAQSCFWISASLLLISLVNHLFFSPEMAKRRGRQEPPALLRDLIRYGLFIISIAVVLRVIWGEQVTPILGALGVGGVVLGFALQETLNNFFAGLALLLEQPFTRGDWIRIGDRTEGVVEHITWRATKIRTRDNDYEIYPNSVVAKEVIVNFRQPSTVHAIRLQVGTSYDDPPSLVRKTILDVLDGVPDVRKMPAPVVYLKAFADFSINYNIKCYIEDYDRRPVIEDQIMDRIWYAFRRAGIEIPFPIQTVFEYRMPWWAKRERKGVDLESTLAAVPLFSRLSIEQVKALASGARTLEFSSGEPVIRQGDPGDTLYVVCSGAARVALKSEDGSERTVARLQPGEFFGEMSLLTGDARAASVHADGALTVAIVPKAALEPILAATPEVAEEIVHVVIQRRQGLDRAHAEAALDTARRAEVEIASKNLLGRIRSFFGLKN